MLPTFASALPACAIAAMLLSGPTHGQTAGARSQLLAEWQNLSSLEAAEPYLGPGPMLRPGDFSPAVSQLRDALVARGWFAQTTDPAGPDFYDPLLVSTVRQFQMTHGLASDGVVGPETRDAINNSAAHRIARINQSLSLPDWPSVGRAIVVNIAAAEVYALDNGVPVIGSLAVVGRDAPEQRTPELVATIRSVTINPTWTVPPGIAARQYGGETFTMPPGPNNPLGRFRLNMPNDYLVYLHDTNEPYLFGYTERAFSSGCVRVEQIEPLARWLLGEAQWAAYDVDGLLQTRRTVTIPLPEPVPVILEYRTASVGPDGLVRYHLDTYGVAAGWSRGQVAYVGQSMPHLNLQTGTQ